MDQGKAESAALDIGVLAGEYDIVGETRAPDVGATLSAYVARRRDGGDEVAILVARGATPGERHALPHYASDAKILADLRHPAVIATIEGRWLDAVTLAVIRQRPTGSSMRELQSTGTSLSNPRIAALLQDVSGAIDWARANGIVHRGVTLDTMHIDPSGRVRVAFVPTPVPEDGVPGATDDARTIGALAAELLTGGAHERTEPNESLARARPDLAERVVIAIDDTRAGRAADVQSLLALIAGADVIRFAEDELAKQRSDWAEFERSHIETWEAERTAAERRAAEIEARLLAEREVFEKHVKDAVKALADERMQIDVERAQLEHETAQLEAHGTRAALTRATDATTNATFSEDANGRRFASFVPMLVTAALIAAAAIGVHLADRQRPLPRAVSINGDSIVPTLPSTDIGRIPRGGFLKQSAAGSVAPRLDSVAPRRDSTAPRRDSVARHDSM